MQTGGGTGKQRRFNGGPLIQYLPYILLLAGFVLLIKGADFLVEGAVSIARRLKISDLVIGLTVVAFGTSTPELFVNLVAGMRGSTALAVGNVLGSNIANILLILGFAAVIYPLRVTREVVRREIPFSLLAIVVLGLLANDRLIDLAAGSQLTRSDGLVLLCFFVIFLYYNFSQAGAIPEMEAQIPARIYGLLWSSLMVVGGLAALTLGGHWIVEGAVTIATGFGLSEEVVGLSIVAVGTSLPELATSAVAATKKNADIAVGNVVGSNIFNIFFVLGISATVRPIGFSPQSNLDLLAVVFASLLLFLFMFSGRRRRVDRWEGAVALVIYVGYIAFRLLVP